MAKKYRDIRCMLSTRYRRTRYLSVFPLAVLLGGGNIAIS